MLVKGPQLFRKPAANGMWLSESDAQIDCWNAQRDSWCTGATKCITSRFDWLGDDVIVEFWRHFHCSVFKGAVYITAVRRPCMSVNKAVSDSDNGLSPVRRQANFWSNAGICLILLLGTYSIETLIQKQQFSFKRMHLNMSSAIWWSFCLGRHFDIIWSNAGIFLIVTLGSYSMETLIQKQQFSFKKMHLNMPSAIWWSFCLGSISTFSSTFPGMKIFVFDSNYTELCTQVSNAQLVIT